MAHIKKLSKDEYRYIIDIAKKYIKRMKKEENKVKAQFQGLHDKFMTVDKDNFYRICKLLIKLSKEKNVK